MVSFIDFGAEVSTHAETKIQVIVLHFDCRYQVTFHYMQVRYLLQMKYVGNVISYDCTPNLETFLT